MNRLTPLVFIALILAGFLMFSLVTSAPPRVGAQDPTLDAALNTIAQRTREAAVTQTSEARAVQQTRTARDATAQAFAFQQTQTALDTARATLTRQAADGQATRQAQADATAQAQVRATATVRAEATATAQVEATGTAQAQASATARSEATAQAHAKTTATARAQATATQVAVQYAEDARQQHIFVERASTVGAVIVVGVALIVLALALARWVWLHAKKPAVVQIVEEPVARPSSKAASPAANASAMPVIERIAAEPLVTVDNATLPATRIVLASREEIEFLDQVIAEQRAHRNQRILE